MHFEQILLMCFKERTRNVHKFARFVFVAYELLINFTIFDQLKVNALGPALLEVNVKIQKLKQKIEDKKTICKKNEVVLLWSFGFSSHLTSRCKNWHIKVKLCVHFHLTEENRQKSSEQYSLSPPPSPSNPPPPLLNVALKVTQLPSLYLLQ